MQTKIYNCDTTTYYSCLHVYISLSAILGFITDYNESCVASATHPSTLIVTKKKLYALTCKSLYAVATVGLFKEKPVEVR